MKTLARLEPGHVSRWLASTIWQTNAGPEKGRGHLEETLLICSSMQDVRDSISTFLPPNAVSNCGHLPDY